MKNLKIKLLALVLSTSGFLVTSCSSEDEGTDSSVLEVNKNVVGTIAAVSSDLVFNTTIAVDEANESEFTYSVTISEAQPVDIHLHVKQVGGDASSSDYVAEDVVIPAYSLTATGSIEILTDCVAEATETLVLQIGDERTANASIPVKTVTFSIANSLSTNLELTFNFNQSFSISGTSYTLCAIGYDMDFYVFDEDMNDMGIYDAATGNCPESLVLADGDLPDGTYFIYYDIFDDGGIAGVYHDPFDIPVTVNYSRCGGIAEGTFVQEDAYVANTTDGSGFDYVMTIQLNAGVFTILDGTGATVASGRSANNAKVEAAIRAARARRR